MVLDAAALENLEIFLEQQKWWLFRDTICTIESLRDSIWEAVAEDMACKTFISFRINQVTKGCCSRLTVESLFILSLLDTICTIESLRDSIWEAVAEVMTCKTFISFRINQGTPGCCSRLTGRKFTLCT